MAVDKKISQLASGAPAQAGDEYVVARSGANYKLTLTNIAASMPATTITSGNLTFSSTAQRITGDFSNATLINRLSFQTSTTNGNTVVNVLPNGTSQISRLIVNNNSDPTNASYGAIDARATEVQIYSAINGTGTYLPMTFIVGGSERVRIDTSGNVGIGTASPGSLLHISSGTTTVQRIEATSTNGAYITYKNNGSDRMYCGTENSTGAGIIGTGAAYAGVVTTASTNPLVFGTNGAERMRIDSSGNVGIGGTPTANRKLELLGSFPVLGGNANSNGIYPVLEVPSAITGSAYVFRTGPSIAASTATTNVFHYLAANVALGSGASLTNSYGFYADAMTSATNNYGFFSNIASGSNRWNFYAAGTAQNYFAGNTGVGNAPPSNVRLQSRGASATSSDYAFGVQNSTPADLFWIRNDGLINTGLAAESPYNKTTGASANMLVDSAGALYRSTSSLRYKSDVTDATHGLADVLKLRSVTYKAKNDGDTVFGGLIAEEVHDAGLTEFVAYDKEGRPDAIHYGNMVALLVKAVQELTARVAELEAK